MEKIKPIHNFWEYKSALNVLESLCDEVDSGNKNSIKELDLLQERVSMFEKEKDKKRSETIQRCKFTLIANR